MLKNFLIFTIRNLRRHKTYSAINILGLSVGIACCVLLGLYIKYELQYDAFHQKAARIYHVVFGTQEEGKAPYYTIGSFGSVAPLLRENLPEAEEVVRTVTLPMSVQMGERGFEFKQCTADPSFFNVFTFPLLMGDPDQVLTQPGDMVISQQMAHTLFGDTDPIGQPLKVVGNVYIARDYRISGVMKNIPAQSHLQFDCVTASRNDNSMMRHVWEGSVPDRPVQIYMLLKKGVHADQILQKLPAIATRVRDLHPNMEANALLDLQPISDVYLYSASRYGIPGLGDIQWLYMLTAISIGILAIVCINYTNLAVALSLRRTQELGIKRTLGATQLQVALQFLAESVLITLFAACLSIALVVLAWPQISTFIDKPVLTTLNTPTLLGGLLFTTLAVGISGGIYPAFFVSRINIAYLTRSSKTPDFGKRRLLRGLIVIQFATAMLFLTGSSVLIKQLEYVKSKDLGHERNHIVILRFYGKDRSLVKHAETINAQFKNHPNVLSLTTSLDFITKGRDTKRVIPEGHPPRRMVSQATDENFAETYGIEVVTGRYFSKDHPSDVDQAVVLNETAVKDLGWKNPIGKSFELWGVKRHVIGVVRDYHIESLKNKVPPLFLMMWPNKHFHISTRIRPEGVQETLNHFQSVWNNHLPGQAFDYLFLNEQLDHYYRSEIQMTHIMRGARWIAVMMACLGLAGLMALSVQQKKKEIAIRRAVGATIAQIMTLLCRPIVGLACFGFLLSVPVAYWLTASYLREFVYRINLGVTPFVTSLLICLIIGLVAVVIQALRAATTNPVESLRQE